MQHRALLSFGFLKACFPAIFLAGLLAPGSVRPAHASLFVSLLRKMMRRRTAPVHLVVDGLPAHKTKLVKDYVASTNGMLTLHFLPGYAPELNPDELVWSHMKRTGVAKAPLRRGEKLRQDRGAACCDQAPAKVGDVILPRTRCRLYYRLVSNTSEYSEWMGHRPALPDSLTVIGRSPVAPNALLAFGH